MRMFSCGAILARCCLLLQCLYGRNKCMVVFARELLR
uniref:Uncharacterized protein n=1 Tax=Zea mays TaxID=4577 RepID=B6TNV6_MAIZE|nr:hypothetical protein [Zea mays]